jgi:alpha-N-arabinofuranosidase
MVNVLQAMILTDGPKMVLTPTYHVFDMYQPFMGATPYAVTIQSPTFSAGDATLPMVDATAARGKDGKLWLALVNADPERAAQIKLGAKGSVKGRVLTADKIDAHNTFDHPDTVAPRPFAQTAGKNGLILNVPSKSVVVVEVDQR